MKRGSSIEIIFVEEMIILYQGNPISCDFFPIDSTVSQLQVLHPVFYHSLTSPEESCHSNNMRCNIRSPVTHLAFCCIPTQWSGEEVFLDRRPAQEDKYFMLSDINC